MVAVILLEQKGESKFLQPLFLTLCQLFSMFVFCFIHFIGAKSVKNISFVNVSKIFDEETKQVGEILFKN